MRTSRVALSLSALAAALALAEPPPDPAQDFETRWAASVLKASKEHVALSKVAWSRKLFRAAFEENRRAADLDPSNVDAQKGAGRKLEGSAWVDDLKSPVKRTNEGSDQEIAAAQKAFDDKKKAAFLKVVKDFEGLAEFATRNKLADQGVRAWKFVLDYDTDHAKARKALGFVRQDERWVPPEDVKKREAGGKKIAAAGDGEEYKEQTGTEKLTGWNLNKRKSEHFLVTGYYTHDELRELVRCAEGARASFIEEFRLEDGALDFSTEFVFVKTTEQHEQFIDVTDQVADHNRAAFRTMGGCTRFEPAHFSEAVQAGGDWGYMKDICVHDTVHHCFAVWSGVDTNAWLDEGMAYWFTDRLLKSAETKCIAFAMTGGGAGGRSWDNPLDWKALVKEMIKDGSNPPMDEVLDGHINSLNARKGCKAWSLVDFMMTKRRDQFFQFIELLRQGSKQDEAIREAFQVKDYRELDERWKDFVFEAY